MLPQSKSVCPVTHTGENQDHDRALRFFQDKLEFTVSPVTLKKMIQAGQPLQIIDLRSKQYFAAGHIPEAINIELDDLPNRLTSLHKDVLTIIYCYDSVCNLGAKAASCLASQGYPLKELEGGYEEWAAHLDFDKTKPPLLARSSSCSRC